jgi:hypothetical protein
LVPQITGGTLPAGPVSEKVSVRQSLAVLTFTLAAKFKPNYQIIFFEHKKIKLDTFSL